MNLKNSFGNLMKQAQQVQADMQKLQEEITKIEVKGEAGAGAVEVIMTGNRDVKRISIIDKSLLQESEQQILEDLLAAACNSASQKVEKLYKEKMSTLTKGLNLPTDFNLPTGE